MRELNLPILIGQQPGFCPLQHPELSSLKASRMLAGTDSTPTCFDSNHANPCIIQKRVEKSNGIAPASDTRQQQVRQPFFLLEDLSPCLVSDYAMKVPDQHRVRMRAIRRAKKIMR